MVSTSNKASISAADEVAAAEANLKAAQARLAAAQQQFARSTASSTFDDSSCCTSRSCPSSGAFPAVAAVSDSAQSKDDAAQAVSSAKPTKDHVAAGIMAIFFGVFGIHKFYMGLTNEGFIMLAVTIIGSLITFGVAAFIVQLIAVAEGLIYLVKTQTQFEQDYVYGKRKWL